MLFICDSLLIYRLAYPDTDKKKPFQIYNQHRHSSTTYFINYSVYERFSSTINYRVFVGFCLPWQSSNNLLFYDYIWLLYFFNPPWLQCISFGFSFGLTSSTTTKKNRKIYRWNKNERKQQNKRHIKSIRSRICVCVFFVIWNVITIRFTYDTYMMFCYWTSKFIIATNKLISHAI